MREGRRLGDRVVRRPRAAEVAPIHLRTQRRYRINIPAATSALLSLALGFAVLIAIGTGLLALPLSSSGEGGAPLLVALFTATSAACVTGLVVVESATYWTGFGQVVILLLMYAGGLGIMTAGAVILVALGRRITLSDRLVLRESMGASSLGSVTRIGRQVVIFATAVQAVGFVILALRLLFDFSAGSAVWHGLFLAVSGFNNAGFSILPESSSLAGYRTDVLIVGLVGVLIVLGSISLPVLMDLMRRRAPSRWALDTRLVVLGVLGLWLIGSVVTLALEFANPSTLGDLPLGHRITSGLFQGVTSRTAGFSTIDFAEVREGTAFIFMILMFIGGASGSTAGGIKINTLMVLLVAAASSLRGREHAEVFRTELPLAQVTRAMAIVGIGVATLCALVIGLAITESAKVDAGIFRFADLLFEATSAFGTVGLSRGITSTVSEPGQLLLTVGMYVGRIGPLTIALGLALRERRAVYRYAQERVRIG